MQSRVRRRSVTRLDIRSLQAWTLAAAYLGGGLTCLVGAAFPMSPRAPVALGVVLGLACLSTGAALIAGARRLPAGRAARVAALGGAAIAGLFVANSHTLAGLVVSASSLPWLGVWAAAFAEPATGAHHRRRGDDALALGVAASDAPGRIAAGAAIAATIWAATVAFVVVAVHVRAHLDTDPLTGLLNRAGLRRAAERVRCGGRPARRAGRRRRPRPRRLQGPQRPLRPRGRRPGADRARPRLGPRVRRPRACWGARAATSSCSSCRRPTAPGRCGCWCNCTTRASVRWTAGVTQWQRGEDLEACLERADHDLYRRKREPGRRAA